MFLSDLTIVTPYGTNVSSCGYCKSTRGSHTYGMSAHFMSCQDYQDLIDRGWRRSGTYLYKPNLRDSCCPQYTIRMAALNYRPSKHQRNLINRFNRFVSKEGDETFEREIQARLKAAVSKDGGTEEEKKKAVENTESTSEGVHGQTAATTSTATAIGTSSTNESQQLRSEAEVKARAAAEAKRQKQKQKQVLKETPKDHVEKIHLAEYLRHPDQKEWRHRFKTKLEPASFTPEKHAVYLKYQVTIHGDDPSHAQPANFRNFLVNSPLKATKPDTWTEQDPGYGSFHQCYYLDEKLIAVAVIDILPYCVSSVYFYYDPDYSALSLGKYSAQREIALVQELHRNPEYASLQYYYMGFYIFTCPKMSYKAQYEPSFLLDPETYAWVELEKCKKILGNKRYSAWVHPEELDPLFEEQVQLIRSNTRTPNRRTKTDDDIDDEEDEDDQWDSVDENEEDMDEDLDPDVFMDNALEGSEFEHDLVKSNKKEDADTQQEHQQSHGGGEISSPRKRVKQNLSPESTAASEKEQEKKKEKKRREEEEAAAAAHAKERERVYKEVTSRRPPGWLDPKQIEVEKLIEVLCLSKGNEILPIVMSNLFKKRKDVRDSTAEFYAAVGEDLAKRLIIFYG